jgi:hypothetical protein
MQLVKMCYNIVSKCFSKKGNYKTILLEPFVEFFTSNALRQCFKGKENDKTAID